MGTRAIQRLSRETKTKQQLVDQQSSSGVRGSETGISTARMRTVCAPQLLPGWACDDQAAGAADVHPELCHGAGSPGRWDRGYILGCVCSVKLLVRHSS